jgi:HD superfamily phosphohydrolase
MVSVISRFLQSIARRSGERDIGVDDSLRFVGLKEIIPVESEEIVHAALLHDIGHMPFSHASEKVLEGLEESFTCGPHSVADIRDQVEDILKKSLAFAEILSILIVLSERFGNFYDSYVRPGGQRGEAVLRIACLIGGIPPEPRLSGVAELISSAAVDADKIDYVNRDAAACGIPVGVDVSRIFYAVVLLLQQENNLYGQI